MLKSILINLLLFVYPFYLIIDGSINLKIFQFGKILIVIFIIVVLDNGFYNLKRAKFAQ